MNPLSAFSFGKVIKSFIPGLIGSVGCLCLIELFYQMAQAAGEGGGSPFWKLLLARSFVHRVILGNSTLATTFAAALIPFALMLGFFLNTILWQFANTPFRNWVEEELDPQLIAAREKLRTCARAELKEFVDAESNCENISVEAYFLPLIDFEKFSYVRESYFSWYEFQANSAVALTLSYFLYGLMIVVLALHWGAGVVTLALYLGFPLVLTILLCLLLVIAAKNNLLRYQERVLLFLVCCVRREREGQPQASL